MKSEKNLYEEYNKTSDKEKRNPLNYEDKTLKWVKSTVETAIKRSEASKEEVLAACMDAIYEGSFYWSFTNFSIREISIRWEKEGRKRELNWGDLGIES